MAGIWYRLGTVTLTSGSKRVTGAGTTWNNAATGPIPGNTFWGPDNKPYEVERVISDLELDIVETYAGATVSGAAYKIDTTRKGTVPALASQVTATLSYAQTQYANMSTWAAGDMPVNVDVVLPDGVSKKSVPNLTKMVAATATAQAAATGAQAAADAAASSAGNKQPKSDNLTALDVPSAAFGRARLNDASAQAARTALDATQLGYCKIRPSTSNLDWNGFGGFTDSGGNKNQFLSLGVDDGNGAGPSSPGPYYGSAFVLGAGLFCCQFVISDGGIIRFRTSYNGGPKPWQTARTTANTTVDSNGFIKNASPILHLYSDGTFTVEEAEGAVARRTDVGTYRIEGSLGFHTEGWYIEGPKDANGRMKFWLDYDQEEDGSINIRTTHREFSEGPVSQRNIIPGLADGDPVDIPAGREITIRLSMPERPIRPMIEPTEEIAHGE